MKFDSEPWGDTLPFAPLRAVWIFGCLLILPTILMLAGCTELQIHVVTIIAPLLACIGTPVQLGMKKLSFADILWVVLIYILMIALTILLNPYWEALLEHWQWNVAPRQEILNEVEENKDWALTICYYLSICVVAPITEEVLFRRIIYGGFRNICPAWLAVIVTSLIFSSVHFFIKGFVSLFIMGMMFNLIFLFRKNLWTSILLHSMVNSIVFFLSFLPKD